MFKPLQHFGTMGNRQRVPSWFEKSLFLLLYFPFLSFLQNFPSSFRTYKNLGGVPHQCWEESESSSQGSRPFCLALCHLQAGVNGQIYFSSPLRHHQVWRSCCFAEEIQRTWVPVFHFLAEHKSGRPGLKPPGCRHGGHLWQRLESSSGLHVSDFDAQPPPLREAKHQPFHHSHWWGRAKLYTVSHVCRGKTAPRVIMAIFLPPWERVEMSLIELNFGVEILSFCFILTSFPGMATARTTWCEG